MRNIKNYLRKGKVYLGIIITIGFFLWISLHVLLRGAMSLDINFIFGWGKKEGASLFPAIINTLIMIGLTLLIAVPIGVGSAIYLNEYTKKGSPVVRVIRLATESLAGIPSIIYGLFGFLFFVLFLGWSWSILAGVCTLSIMVLPTIIKSTEEALKAVPDSYREGSYALGAGKLRTIYKMIVPSAISGILVAVILSIGRIVGETAALILTAGTVMGIPKTLMNSGSTLSVFMYTLTTEGADFDKAYGVAIILMIIVFGINILAYRLAKRFRKA